MLRFALIYSCAMVVAGSSLLAELPEESSKDNVAPAVLEIQPTPAKHILGNSISGWSPEISDWERIKTLRAKKQQLEQLQLEVGELEKTLGVARQYHLQCLMAEVSLKKLKAVNPTVDEADGRKFSLVEFITKREQPRTIPTLAFRFVEEMLNESKAMKTLASPTLVVSAYDSATVRSGGEFPVLVPAGGKELKIDWREFGVNFSASVEPIGRDRIKVHVVPECSERDFKNSVKIDGTVVPGLTSRSLNFDAEMQLSETVIVSLMAQRDEKDPIALLTAITVTKVEPLAATGVRP